MAFGSSFSLSNYCNIPSTHLFSSSRRLEHSLLFRCSHLHKPNTTDRKLNFEFATSILKISSQNEVFSSSLTKTFTCLPFKSLPLGQPEKESMHQGINPKVESQQIKDMSIQITLLCKKTDKFLEEVKDLEEKYDEEKMFLKEQGNVQGSLLAAFEYFKGNQDNLLRILSSCISQDEYCVAKEQFKKVSNKFKWTNCLALLIFQVRKFCISSRMQADVDKLYKRFQELKLEISHLPTSSHSSYSETIDLIHDQINQLERQVKEDQDEALVKGRAKLDKLAGKFSTIPLERIGGIIQKKAEKIGTKTLGIYTQFREIFAVRKAYAKLTNWVFHLQPRILVNINCPEPIYSQQSLYEEVGIFLKSLESCKTIQEVQKILEEKGITEEIPPTFDEWNKLFKGQRFSRHLVQCYYHSINKRPFMNKGHIERILDKLKDEKNKKVERCSAELDHHIDQCQNLNFAQTKAYFQKLHIHIDRIQIPKNPDDAKLSPADQAVTEIDYQDLPQTKDEWNQCVQDPEFRKALATQWVDYQETTGQLAMHMIRQALLSKNSIERQFLFFRNIEYIIKIASSIIQIALCLPEANVWLATSVIELFVTDLAKLGMPGMGLMSAFQPIYPDISFKLESLIMTVVEHFFAIKHKPYEYSLEGYCLTFSIRWLGLVANFHYLISLFEQALLWVNIRLIKNCIMHLEKRPLEEEDRYIEINETYEQNYLNYKRHVKDLKERLNQLRLLDAKLFIHSRNPDALQDLANVLQEVDFSYLSVEVREFFEKNLGLKLNETNKKRFKKNLEQLFSESEDKFASSHKANYWSYLRA